MIRSRQRPFSEILLLAAVLLLTSGLDLRAVSPKRQPGLRIVVVEGEDAVNVIQQRTAVAPVVEVRDRNDQPVAGAIVRFAITQGRATFGGARTITVTTNAAGRAAVAGLTPTGAGTLQISASAAFQGQTAVATIAQTNVMTAAQAAGASGSAGGASGGSANSASGGVGGGGGAFPLTTLGVIGGAAVGGVIVVEKTLLAGDIYAAPLQRDLTANWGTCSTASRWDATLELHLTVSDGSVTGHAELSGTSTDLSTTCQNVPLQTNQNFGWSSTDPQVGGTTGNITFTHNPTFSFGGSQLWNFTGALTGDQVIGRLTYTQMFPVGVPVGVSDFSLTMTKR